MESGLRGRSDLPARRRPPVGPAPRHRHHLVGRRTRVLSEGLTLMRCGGHFEGCTGLHWAGGAGGRGVLLTRDILQVVAGRKHVSFMYSYPNFVPLSASAVERIVEAGELLEYDRVYGAFWDMVIDHD